MNSDKFTTGVRNLHPTATKRADLAQLASGTAQEIIAAVPGLSVTQLQALFVVETNGKKRATVLDAINTKLNGGS